MGRIRDVLRHRGCLYSAACAALLLLLFALVPPIPQPEAYHRFADRRTLIGGVPNTLNVVSNFPFLIIGVFGLVTALHGNRFGFTCGGEVAGWACFFLGVAATAFGSAYYHLRPNDGRLVWDRLPMTVAFTSLVVLFVVERLSERGGTVALLPALAAGIASVAYWRLTDDLRPYLLVQFVPLLLLPALALLTPAKYSHSAAWLGAAACYAAAKLAEVGDGLVFRLSGAVVSGHTVKHLLAAAVPVYLLLMLHRRALLAERVSELERWGWGPGRGREKAGEATGQEGLFGDEEEGAAQESQGLLPRGSSSEPRVS
ncbi:hypothetical protein KFL_005910070 [Klebsormidium nitens]|uniref:Ceramidase n=1 Tax=Klebsormidium nitens TaxID=105231 RepID=A0A1Y1IIV0_KLENI|nr:hypothetical protein KFL_005910070 [Klebsormidium nitens]|eukprot:GAQ90032.1 hypothetical protein KFL_005910070 [Klebsormidium nitens]